MTVQPSPLARPYRREYAETLRLAWPLALANLLQMLTYAVDVMFIARLGSAELAASALAIAIYGLVIWALGGLVGALAPMAAAELGARGPALRPIRRTVRMALWLAVMSGSAAMALCAAAEPLMLLAGQDPHLAALAGQYMDLLLWSIIPMVGTVALRQFVSTLGRPIFATIITGAGIGINSLANYALVFGNFGFPAMGLEGAAIATLITSLAIFGAYVVAIRLDRRLHAYHIFGFFWRPDWQRLRELVRIGAPIALTISAEAGVFAAAAFLMGLLGEAQLAAHTLALQIIALAFQVPFGVSQAATIRVGYFFGAGDDAGVRRAGWAAIVMGTGFMLLTAAALLFAPVLLLHIYLDPFDPANAQLVRDATAFLVIGAAFQLSDGMQVVAAGALRGLKDTRVPMYIALFAYWVPGFGLAAGLGFGLQLGGQGVWLGLAAGLTCAAAMLLLRWTRRERLGLLMPQRR